MFNNVEIAGLSISRCRLQRRSPRGGKTFRGRDFYPFWNSSPSRKYVDSHNHPFHSCKIRLIVKETRSKFKCQCDVQPHRRSFCNPANPYAVCCHMVRSGGIVLNYRRQSAPGGPREYRHRPCQAVRYQLKWTLRSSLWRSRTVSGVSSGRTRVPSKRNRTVDICFP